MSLARCSTNGYARGLALTVGGTLLVSFEALFLRLIAADIWTVIWWRGLLLGVTTLVVLALAGRSLQLRSLGAAGWVAVLAFATCIFFFVSAINTTTVANTLVIASAAPLFAAIQSWIFLRERMTSSTWIAVVIVLVGIAVIFSGSLQTSFIFGDLFALAYAGCLAAYYVALRRCSSDQLLSVVAYGGLVSGLLAWPMAAPAAVAPADLWLLFALGIVVVPASTLLLSLGTQYIPAPHVTLIMMLEMILGPLWVWLALSEIPAYASIVGGALILATVVCHSFASTVRSAAA